MKKMFALSIAFLLLLSSCGNHINHETGIPGEGSEELYFNQAVMHLGANFTMTEDTVYFINNYFYYNYGDSPFALYYVDKATGIGGPLCGKPECSHTDNSCNAYIYSAIADGLSNYNGVLYWSGADTSGYHIYSVQYDGTDRRIVRNLDKDIMEKIKGDPFTTFCDGYAYFCGKTSNVENGEAHTGNIVVAYPLIDGEEYIPILEKDYTDMVCNTRILPYGGVLYIMIASSRVAETEKKLELYSWDPKTHELKTLYDDKVPFYGWEFCVTDNGVYVTCAESGIIYQFVFETGKPDVLFDFCDNGEDSSQMIVTNAGFVNVLPNGDNARQFVIKDFEGSLLCETVVDIPRYSKGEGIVGEGVFVTPLGADSENLYYYLNGVISVPLDGSEARLLWSSET